MRASRDKKAKGTLVEFVEDINHATIPKEILDKDSRLEDSVQGALGRAGGVSSRPIGEPAKPERRGAAAEPGGEPSRDESPGGDGGKQEQEGARGSRDAGRGRPRAQPPAGSKSARGKKTGWGRRLHHMCR
ncbi:hypothetical protein CapIbe_015361 [Capra ibex]